MTREPTVFVVDDDPALRESLRWLIESVGLGVETYATAREFLDRYDPGRPGCLVLDVRMPGMSGLDLQDELAVRHATVPVIIITAFAEVPMAVRALKAGAVDFIEKPFEDQALLERIQQAIRRDRQAREAQTRQAQLGARLAGLTRRERQVYEHMIDGKSSKAIAAELGVSPKTIEVHRAHVLAKMGVNSVAELIRLAVLRNAGKRRR